MVLLVLIWAAVAAPLTLDVVLEAVDARVPALAAAEAKLTEAEAKLLSARGAFDPKLAAKASAYTGKYAREELDSKLLLPTALGPEVELGWRRGVGEFPSYDDSYTADAGELRVGVSAPLLEGLGLGAERAKLLDGRLGQQSAEASLDDKRIQVRRKAEEAWWKWVAAGASAQIALRQLELAVERDRALQVEVREGSRALIEQLDNERVLFERRGKLALADQKLGTAALVLSLWFRDADGLPVVPAPDQLPALAPPGLSERGLQADVASAERRPDLRVLLAEVQRGEVAAARGRNLVLPRLDGKVEARQDLTDEPTEVVLGAELSVPLWLRKGRGERDRASAALAQASQAERGLRDQVRADVAAAHLAREASAEWAEWSLLAAERAEQVLALQRRSWDLGASDLFVLLQREGKLAEAREKAVEAQLQLALADVALRAVVGEL
ncbi:MAG: cobalt-zinc-cadmium efflux system outer membrane protein [Myxococcota bacterium]|jgi:cobalt-zinc-cadmium efflux system outer membrane protein